MTDIAPPSALTLPNTGHGGLDERKERQVSSESPLMESRLAEEARARLTEYKRRARASSGRATEARRKSDEAGDRQSRRHAAAMSKLLTIRFPDGETEYRTATEEIEIGDTLIRGAVSWRVAMVDLGDGGTTIVTLASAGQSLD